MSGELAVGWEALRGGRWEAARAVFEAATASEPSAEGFEGLSWAAWWCDDAEAVFAARECAYRLYRRRGDAAGAARMATWLAADELDFNGALSVSSGWLGRARRLIESLEERPEHGWLAFHEGYVARLGADNAVAAERAAVAARLGRRFKVPDLEMLGLALEGATLVACARVEEGMRRLDEATATALEDEAALPMSCAWTFCLLVTACTAVSDYDRAAEWCARIGEFAERFAAVTCSPSVGRNTARCTYSAAAGRRRSNCSRPLSRTSSARVRRWSAARWQASRSCAAVKAGRRRRRRCWIGQGPAARCSCAAHGLRLTAATRARRPICSSGCCARRPRRRALTARRRSSCSCTLASRRARSRRLATRSSPCAPWSGARAPRRCARVRISRRRCSPRPPMITSARARCWRTRPMGSPPAVHPTSLRA